MVALAHTVPVPASVPELSRRLKQKALHKSDDVAMICCAGDRSRRAGNCLAGHGFMQLGSVVDGFEADRDLRDALALRTDAVVGLLQPVPTRTVVALAWAPAAAN
jgi:hypothetical protein